ncbi:MAG: hypothetical protein Q9220_004838 [cf. Caloplaca sp. 1 TL-2023]
MASNFTRLSPDSSSPSCTLFPQEPLLPWLSDTTLAIILPTIVYAVAGAFFHILDVYDLFTSYRIHPTADELKRNHVSKWDCFKSVVRYHIMQISIGLALNYGNTAQPMIGDERCKIHDTAIFLHSLRNNIVPILFNLVGIDAKRLSTATSGTSATLASFVSAAPSSSTPHTIDRTLAKLIISIGIPLAQYALALVIVDTWIYFTHRLCHVNRTLYRLVHAQHHRLYVSYAYGAVYAHWLETLFLDILSFVLAGEIAQLSPRQSMLFGTLATIKTISDHCGYVFPWDFTRVVNGNGAVFHDLHHQSWGLKYNFSTYTTFWDNLLGTSWRDAKGAEKRYRRVHELTAKQRLEDRPVTDRGVEREVAEKGVKSE